MISQGERRIFLLRHCPTCANVAERPRRKEDAPPTELTNKQEREGLAELKSSARTMCADLSPLAPARTFYRALQGIGKEGGLFCSPLPRAIVTATSLGEDVSPETLAACQRAMRACEPPPSKKELLEYMQRGACPPHGKLESPYCSAKRPSVRDVLGLG